MPRHRQTAPRRYTAGSTPARDGLPRPWPHCDLAPGHPGTAADARHACFPGRRAVCVGFWSAIASPIDQEARYAVLPEAVTTGSYVRVCDLYAMEAQPGLASPEGARGGGISGRRRRAPKCRRVREVGLNGASVDDLHHWPPGPSTPAGLALEQPPGVPSGRGRAARPGPGAAGPGRGPCACWRRVPPAADTGEQAAAHELGAVGQVPSQQQRRSVDPADSWPAAFHPVVCARVDQGPGSRVGVALLRVQPG